MYDQQFIPPAARPAWQRLLLRWLTIRRRVLARPDRSLRVDGPVPRTQQILYLCTTSKIGPSVVG
ncbi:MAG: hypothetical protein SNJ69_04145 [Chloroflexaceae bacterium]